MTLKAQTTIETATTPDNGNTPATIALADVLTVEDVLNDVAFLQLFLESDESGAAEQQSAVIRNVLAGMSDAERAAAVDAIRLQLAERDGGHMVATALNLPMPPRSGEPLHHEDEDGADYFLTLTADYDGHAECVRRYTAGKLLYTDVFGWLAYNGQHFEPNASTKVRGIVKEILKKRRAAAESRNMDGIVKSTKLTRERVGGTMYMLAPDVLTEPDDLDSEPHLLNCANGVVDLRTGELTPHSPAQRFTYAVPTAYNPNADTRGWRALVTELAGDSQLMERYLQEAVGYSITGSTREEIMFYIHGPTRGGKGTFIETILATLGGMPIATEVSFAVFSQPHHADSQNFALAPLRPCRLVAGSESKDDERLNAAKVKAITGGNLIYCAHKNKDFFSYKPQFKVWLSSNYPVNANPDDDAIWSRLRVIEFPHSFAGRENKLLKHQLRRRESLEAVLAWAVQGAIAWYGRDERGMFTPSKVQAATDGHRSQQDFVGQWLAECIKKTDNEDDFIANEPLYGSYKAWCELNGVTPRGKRRLTMTLAKKGYGAGKQKKAGGRNQRGCVGVQFQHFEPIPVEL